MRYAFFGTGIFAAECLELLAKWRLPSWIVTSPPKASGRGNKIVRTPVGEMVSVSDALRGITLIESASVSSDESILGLKRNMPVDFSFVIDFGQLIREPLLAWTERVGCLNIHPSALPLYRGAAPIQRALMDGAGEIGVSVFKLARRMDAGPVLLREMVRAEPHDDFGSLRPKAAAAGVAAFTRFAGENPVNTWKFEPQDESLATNATKIAADEERICWRRPARDIVRQIRALSPKPGAWTTLRGKRLLILSARESDAYCGDARCAPGELRLDRENPLAFANGGFVELLSVQPEGRKPQPAAAWKNGLRVASGECVI